MLEKSEALGESNEITKENPTRMPSNDMNRVESGKATSRHAVSADELKPDDAQVPSEQPSESEGTRTRKIKIRQAIKDKGVFETGVEVVEHEVELDEDEDGRVQALRLYNDGKLTHG